MTTLELPKPLQTLLELSKRQVAKVNLTASENTWQADTLSKIGGIGYLPIGELYPTNEQGEPLALLFQLNFAQLANEVDISQLAYELPNQGILQVYIEKNGVDLNKRQVRFYENDNIAQNDSELKNAVDFLKKINEKYLYPFELNKQILMQFSLSYQSCNFHCLEYYNFLKKIEQENSIDVKKYLYELDRNLYNKYYKIYGQISNNDRDKGNNHFLLGYPEFAQFEPRNDIDIHIGDDGEFVEIHRGLDDYISLLQIDSHYDEERNAFIEWGDCGIANFFIHPNDLKNKDFSKLVYYWDCY